MEKEQVIAKDNSQSQSHPLEYTSFESENTLKNLDPCEPPGGIFKTKILDKLKPPCKFGDLLKAMESIYE